MLAFGIILSLAFLVSGVAFLTSQSGTLFGFEDFGAAGGSMFITHTIRGAPAIALGIACLGVSLMLHSRFVLREWFGLRRIATVGEATGLVSWLVSFGYVIWTVGTNLRDS